MRIKDLKIEKFDIIKYLFLQWFNEYSEEFLLNQNFC